MAQLLDASGTPIEPRRTLADVPAQLRRASMMTAYRGASTTDPDLATWSTHNPAPQIAIGNDRNALAGRIHDLARNDGWANGGVSRIVDSVIGSGWRLSSRPNHRSLGITPEQAEDVATRIESKWRDWAEDLDNRCDAQEQTNFGGLLAKGFRHRIWDGEAFAVLHWIRRRTFYRTAVEVIHPDRCSTPMAKGAFGNIREGVEMNARGAATAYHFRKAHPGDWHAMTKLWQWERVQKITGWGRRVVVHAFEATDAGQVRGVSPLAPILKQIRMLGRYDELEMQAALVNAVLAAFITTPHDPEQLAQAMTSQRDGTEVSLSDQQAMRLEWYEKSGPITVPGVKVNFLAPGEEAKLTNPNHPNSVFEAFERACLRNIATAIGVSYEQLSMDWSQVNYSSARAALLEIWRGFTARKDSFAAQFAQPIFAAWLEEAIDKGDVVLPAGAPDFYTARNAWCASRWIGPGRGWVDPQKEAKAAEIRLQNGLSTLEDECAEQGKDWQDIMDQRSRERKRAMELGLPDPHAAPQPGNGGAVDTVDPADMEPA